MPLAQISNIASRLHGKIIREFNKHTLRKNRVTIKDFSIQGRLFIQNHGKICIGKNFMCNSGIDLNPIGRGDKTRFVVSMGGSLSIGDHVGISNSTIYCTSNVSIGDHTLIGGGCAIWDTDFHSTDPNIRRENFLLGSKSAPIVIEDNVFIGAGSIILKGVTVGRNSVIGAGSVVTRNIPTNEVWCGNPARFIKRC